MSGGSSIRRRLLVAFMLLAAGLGLTMGMVGLLSYDRLGTHLVDWYARPVMNALIEAEERSRRAEDRGRHNNLVYRGRSGGTHGSAVPGGQADPRNGARWTPACISSTAWRISSSLRSTRACATP